MNGKLMLYIDQNGLKFFAHTVRQLERDIRAYDGKCARAAKMYRDKQDRAYHIGYVIGVHWLLMYQPVEL